VGYSPERINPGDRTHTLTNVIKVVAGDNPETLDRVAELYGSIVQPGVHRVSSIKVAEACKVIENTQRDLNIALMNELAIIFNRLGIDTLEVLGCLGSDSISLGCGISVLSARRAGTSKGECCVLCTPQGHPSSGYRK
jgi:UDP-N-acetyl-D-galactosamine dehydrogenase